MMNITNSSRLSRTAWTLAAVSALVLTGCDTDEILDVTDPDTVNPGTLQDPELIDIVVAGAIGEFTVGYSGNGGDAYLSVSSLMSDELFASGSFTTRIATDRREQFSAQNGNTSDGAYINLQQARRALKDAAVQVAAIEDLGTSSDEYVRLKALEGYTYIALAEGYCSGVPISNVEDGNFVYGQPTSTAELISSATAIFDAAIAGGGQYANLARVGKARALLSAADYAGAAQAVSSVPTGFVYHVEHSVNGATNPIYSLQGNGRYSVSDREGGNQTGVDFRSAGDPRVQWYEDPAGGFDANYALYVSEKYTDFTSPVALATGVEARLIEAEAALAAGQPGQMIGILNTLRADVDNLMAGIQPDYQSPGVTLDPLTDPGNAAARVDMLFRERALWLFLTGTRLGDLRRLVRDYGRTQDQVYPSGDYVQGGDHGSDVVFPIDFDETNNPNYSESVCDVTSVN